MEREQQQHCHFSINDSSDILTEILGRLDGRSLGVAACVCRLWSSVCRSETVWESVCARSISSSSPATSSSCGPRTRGVVAALGGYRRLYRTCVGPALGRLGEPAPISLSLSMSLFSIDCYERLWLSGKESPTAANTISLLFLANNAVLA